MTSIIIKNYASKEIYTAPVTKDAREVRKLGGAHYIEFPIDTDTVQPFTRGCFIQVDGKYYYLKRDAAPEPIQGVNGYRYVLKFYAKEHDMDDVLFKLEGDAFPGRPFSLTSSLRDFAYAVTECMINFQSNKWWYDNTMPQDNDMREISFEGENCREAANKIANEYGVEWWVEENDNGSNVIHFGKCEKGDERNIKEGEIVNRFPVSKRGDDSNYGTRFYIFGGTTNVPNNYRLGSDESDLSYVAPRRICLREFTDLGIPAKDTNGKPIYPEYYDVQKEGITGNRIQKQIVVDNIYPKETRVIENLTTAQKDIGLANKVLVYTITSEDALVKQSLIVGTVGITFTSGDLKGQSFDVKLKNPYGSSGTYSYRELEIVPRVDNMGGGRVVITPGRLKPEIKDSFILTGVNVGDKAIEAAELELWKKGRELADRYAADTNIYDCETNPVYCAANDIKFDIGQKVVLMGAHFGTEGRKSRVQGYERKLYNPYIATYSIGDNTVYSRGLRMSKLINMTARVAEQSTLLSRNNAFQIRTGISAAPTTVAE